MGKTKLQMTPDTCIILFVKAPVRGHVKTRLAEYLDAGVVAALYRSFVGDSVRKITALGLPLHIFYDPPGSESIMRSWLGDDPIYVPQNGDGLGERMGQAFQHVFHAGIHRAVLTGTDLPDLPGEMIAQALSALDDHEAVIGPSKDGGYYLIGFQSGAFTTAAFDGISWSSEAVFQATMNRLGHSGLSVHQLAEWRDIDTHDDLLDLIETLKKQPERAPETAAYLKNLGMMGD